MFYFKPLNIKTILIQYKIRLVAPNSECCTVCSGHNLNKAASAVMARLEVIRPPSQL